jgi:catechol 2,3-dioxygenase-like lactoylglutathione lyase family enzyme
MAEADLALTIFYVADLAKTVAFFDAAFGFKKSTVAPQYVEYQVNAGACLGLMPQSNTGYIVGDKLGRLKPTDGSPRGELYLLVPDPEAAVKRLQKAGATCTSPLQMRDWGDRAAYFLIPDGYVIAVAERVEREA